MTSPVGNTTARLLVAAVACQSAVTLLGACALAASGASPPAARAAIAAVAAQVVRLVIPLALLDSRSRQRLPRGLPLGSLLGGRPGAINRAADPAATIGHSSPYFLWVFHGCTRRKVACDREM
jgi:hypothetical protein